MIWHILATISLSYIIYTWIKSYFSPLHHIPQPLELPFFRHNLYFRTGQDMLSVFEHWGKKFKEYGMYKFHGFASFKDYTVVLLKPEYVKTVLTKPAAFKRTDFVKKFFPLSGSGVLVSEGQHHRFQKKIISKAFSLSNMKHYTPIFNKHVDILIKLWKDITENASNGVSLDVKSYFSNLSFDVITEIGFGCHFNVQTTESADFLKLLKKQSEGSLNFLPRFLLNVFPFMWYLPFGPAKVVKDSLNTLTEVMNMVIRKRKEKISNNALTSEEEKDFLSIMMNGEDENSGKKFSEQLVLDNAYILMIAGHETTAATLPGILFYLTKKLIEKMFGVEHACTDILFFEYSIDNELYPEYQEKARKEIQESLAIGEDISYDSLSLVPFTVAFIKESIRMYTSIPVNGRVSEVDYKFGDYVLPKGTHVFWVISLLNMDEDSFDDSFKFIPERYLEGSDFDNGTSFTFGYGPYSCLGKNFAVQEIYVVIIKLLRNFKFQLDPEQENFKRRILVSLTPTPPLKVRVIPLK